MIERTEQRFDIKPERLAGDTAYGSGANLDWLVNEAKIAPHIPVIDKSKREDGTFSREDFSFDKEPQRLHLSGRQGSHHDWQGRHRWGDTVLPGQDTRLPQLPPQGHLNAFAITVLCIKSAEFGGSGVSPSLAREWMAETT
jgi:hypothetical protein